MSPMSKKDWVGFKILAGVVAVIIIMLIVMWKLKGSMNINLCDDKHLKAHTIIVIDITDPLTDGQQKRVSELVEGIKDDIKTHEKFSIFLLDSKLDGLSHPLFSICKPPSGSEANPLYENQRMYQKKYNEQYQNLFKKILPCLCSGGEGVQSPIMEALVEVGQRPDFSRKVAERCLVLISDLLQNTDRFSFYHHNLLTANKLEQAISQGGLVPTLQGVQVELHIIQRLKDRQLQNDLFINFWESYFRDAGAQITQITKRF